MEWWKEG